MPEDNQGDSVVDNEDGQSYVTIDIKSAEDAAKKFDFAGRDLGIHIDYDFKSPTAMNFVVLDPVLYSTSAFVEVIDVATSNEGEDFKTVDGFHDQTFDKVLTPEANKVVPEEVAKKTLAPSAFSYQGLGVFTFPVRIAEKLRVSLVIKDPVPNFYERLHVITQETTTEVVTTKKTKRRGLF
jgi:hypothetical protein